MSAALRMVFGRLQGPQSVPLGQYTKGVGGGTPSRANPAYFEGTIPWITVADLAVGQVVPQTIRESRESISQAAIEGSAAKILPVGSVVLATRVSVGKVGIAEVPLATNQDFTSFPPIPNIDSRFLAYCLAASTSQLRAAARGTTIQGLRRSDVLAIRVPQLNLEMQREIVKFLDIVDGEGADAAAHVVSRLPRQARDIVRRIQIVERVDQQLKKARNNQVLIGSALDAIIPATLNRLFGDGYKGTSGTRLVTWRVLDELVEDVADGPHVTPRYVENGVPFVTVRNITTGRVVFRNHKFISQQDHLQFQKRAKAERGDVLISKDGTIGVPCLIDTDKPFSFFVSVALIKPKKRALDGAFLAWVLRTPCIQDRIAARARGDMIRHLVLREIRALKVPVLPLEEQRTLAAQLDRLQARIEDAQRHHQLAQELIDELPASLEAEVEN